VGQAAEEPELVGAVAELDARAAADGIDERTAEELLLRLRERRIRRELADADPARTLELQAALAKIRSAMEELATAQPVSR
jgi:coenzyme F420-reducing hydrogenase alpha subunit